MTPIKAQFNLVFIALTFLTRVPAPVAIDYSQQNLNQASRYFPLIGFLIGAFTALLYWLFSQILPANVAILFSMIASFLITGGFHEDGLADTCDGLGGGFEVESKLSIMKDSRIGTYGALAIWSVLSLKFALLINLENVVVALLVAHPLSRSVSTMMIPLLPYIQDADQSKSKPLAESQNNYDWIIALVIGLSSLVFVAELWWMLVLALTILVVVARQFLIKQIGGFTGDTLGAIQQISEILIYTVILAGAHSL